MNISWKKVISEDGIEWYHLMFDGLKVYYNFHTVMRHYRVSNCEEDGIHIYPIYNDYLIKDEEKYEDLSVAKYQLIQRFFCNASLEKAHIWYPKDRYGIPFDVDIKEFVC